MSERTLDDLKALGADVKRATGALNASLQAAHAAGLLVDGLEWEWIHPLGRAEGVPEIQDVPLRVPIAVLDSVVDAPTAKA